MRPVTQVFFNALLAFTLFGFNLNAWGSAQASQSVTKRGNASPTTLSSTVYFAPTETNNSFLAKATGYTAHFNGIDTTLFSTSSKSFATLEWINANRQSKWTALNRAKAHANFLIGSKKHWRTGVPLYEKIKYADLYPGIDLVFYGKEKALEYDFVVHPNADPNAIRFRFNDTGSVAKTSKGDIAVDLGGTNLIQYRPYAYQEKNGKKVKVEANYELDSNTQQIKIVVAQYDSSKPLVIDPVLSFTTYVGGSGFDEGRAIAIDSSENIYVAGTTSSASGLSPTGYDTSCNTSATCDDTHTDAFVAKYNSSGVLQNLTYVGGDGIDSATAIALDASNNVYVAGLTFSADFPVLNAYQASLSGVSSAFLVKLNNTLSGLSYSTYLGGTDNTGARGIAVATTDKVYVTGTTTAVTFTTDTNIGPNGLSDFFVAKFDTSLVSAASKLFITRIGGSGNDYANAIALDASENIFITGATASTDFPTTVGVVDTTCGSDGSCDTGKTDAIVLKLAAGGASLSYSTYLGGANSDNGSEFGAIAVDTTGNAFVTGATLSSDFPTTVGAYDTSYCGTTNSCASADYYDAFLTKLNPTGTAISFSTLLGGQQDDIATAISLNTNSVSVTGFTSSYSSLPVPFPMVSPVSQVTSNSIDAFITEFSNDGSALLFSTPIGGSSEDKSFAFAIIPTAATTRNIWITGKTASTDFAARNNNYTTSSSDMFFSKISASDTNLAVSVTETPDPVATGKPISYTITFKNNNTIATITSIVAALSVDNIFDLNSITATQGPCTTVFPITCTIGTLNAGASANIKIAGVPTSTGLLMMNVSTTATELASPIVLPTMTSVNAANFDLTITTTGIKTDVAQNDIIDFSFTIDNPNDIDATNVIAGVTLPADAVLLGYQTPSPGDCSGAPVVSCTLGTIATKSNTTVQLQYKATTPVNGIIRVAVIATEMYGERNASLPVNVRGENGSGGGGDFRCFIATAAYGSYLEPDVILLRNFRDTVLLKNSLGIWFVERYYELSPPIAHWVREYALVKVAVRASLAPVVFTIRHPILSILLIIAVVAWLRSIRTSRRPLAPNTFELPRS